MLSLYILVNFLSIQQTKKMENYSNLDEFKQLCDSMEAQPSHRYRPIEKRPIEDDDTDEEEYILQGILSSVGCCTEWKLAESWSEPAKHVLFKNHILRMKIRRYSRKCRDQLSLASFVEYSNVLERLYELYDRPYSVGYEYRHLVELLKSTDEVLANIFQALDICVVYAVQDYLQSRPLYAPTKFYKDS